MLFLPSFDPRHREYEVLIGGGFARAIDHAGAGDEIAWIDGVDRVVGPVAAGDPMDWRIEMRSRVLAATEVVPVPFAAAAFVVVGDLARSQTARIARIAAAAPASENPATGSV